MLHNAKAITGCALKRYSDNYANDIRAKAMTNALSKTDINTLAFCTKGNARMQFKFSLDIPTMGITNQKSSGRCWLFAGLNTLREIVGKKLNVEFFELSQNYTAFWDKYEKINYFLESVIDTADRDTDDRTVAWIMSTGIQDGGQWDMFVSLVKKYGVVAKDAMPETYQSSNTGLMNRIINEKLKMYAVALRKMVNGGASLEAIQVEKDQMLSVMYTLLCECFGEPPCTFDYEYIDKDKKYHKITGCTPESFYNEYVGDSLDEYVSIINAPTKDKPYGRSYTVDYLGNVVGGNEIRYLNVPMEEMKKYILAQMKDNTVVWFGSDVGKFGDRAGGVWDDGSFDYESMFGFDLALSKEDGLDYRFSCMNHAMVITGANIVCEECGKVDRWKIENSWGDQDKANGGYYIMSDSWFDRFVYQAVINKKYLPESLLKELDNPIHLNPWDPMGSLAD